jgi:integrase
MKKPWLASANSSVTEWINDYIKIINSRKYALKTWSNKTAMLKQLSAAIGDREIIEITPRDLDSFIQSYASRDKLSAAKQAFVLVRDVFREAWMAGLVQYSPAIPLKPPRNKVKRSRLVLSEWQRIYKTSKTECQPYMQHALALAITTSQRRGDISKMRRKDIWDDHLHIEQEKTGFKLALPLALYCPALGMTLAEVIERCPGKDYLLANKRIMPWSITTGFKKVRDKAFSGGRWKHPPTFNEQRSLAERIYREAKVDTQRLLGHKSRYMTDQYNDNRGREWNRLIL